MRSARVKVACFSLLEGKGHADVGDEVVAADAAAGGGAEEGDDLGDLVGGDDHTRGGGPLRFECVPAAGMALVGPELCGVGGDEAGQHAVDGDVVGGELDGEVAHELLERRLGRTEE